MHVAKYTACGVANLIAHFERTHNESRSYDNQNIDKSKTHLNYNLAEDGNGKTGYQKYKDRLDNVYHINRADINTMVSIVITLPKDYDGDAKTFFNDCKEFFDLRYGADNCIGAYVHYDEVSRHMHYLSIPVVPNKDYGKEGKTSKDYQCRLNAKKVISKTELQRLHPDLQAFLRQRQPDKTINIINGEVARHKGNRTVNELKAQEIERKAQELQAKDKAITAKRQELTAKEQELQAKSEQVTKDIEALRGHDKRITPVDSVRIGIRQREYVPYSTYIDTCKQYNKALDTLNGARVQIEQLERRASKPSLDRQALQAERELRQQAEDRARQAEDRLHTREGDKEVARSQAFYDVLGAVGINDWQSQQRLKNMFDKATKEHLKQIKEQERAKVHAHQHDRSEDFAPRR